MQKKKLIVIKIGTHVLHQENGLNNQIISNVVKNISEFLPQNYQFIIVSSGAVASGKKLIQINKKLTHTRSEQIYAAVGQVDLINTYQKYFNKYQIKTAQALFTRRDFSDRDRYLSMKEVLKQLLNNNIVPIINENDVLCTEELNFSDNDQLSAYVSAMLNADYLLILSNVEGLYDAHPQEGGKLVKKINKITPQVKSWASTKKSDLGRGGMPSKLETAKFIMDLGIPMYLASGHTPNIVKKIITGKKIGTIFNNTQNKETNSLKRWLKMGAIPSGTIVVCNFIADLLEQGRRASILSIGIEEIKKPFKKGDIVQVINEKEQIIGLGMAKISSAEFKIKEQKEINGQKKSKIIIHTDYFIKQ